MTTTTEHLALAKRFAELADSQESPAEVRAYATLSLAHATIAQAMINLAAARAAGRG